MKTSNTVVKIKIGRDASTGQFIPVKTALARPKTTTVETIKLPVKPSPKKRS